MLYGWLVPSNHWAYCSNSRVNWAGLKESRRRKVKKRWDQEEKEEEKEEEEEEEDGGKGDLVDIDLNSLNK